MERPERKGMEIDRRGFFGAVAGSACGACLAGLTARAQTAPTGAVDTPTAQKGLIKRKPSPWFEPLERGAIRCTLCPRECRIARGRRGPCRARENRDGECYSLVYGNPSLVQLDPVERKPFFHVLPGERALSISTVGCPIECMFCEVWDMALVGPEDVYAYDLPPDMVVRHARDAGARAVSYAFGEPVAFYEYMADTAALAREADLLNLVHTSGYITPEPLQELIDLLDAANVDLKSFDPEFYRETCDAELEPVLETLKLLKAGGVHVEITNILIPTLNDDVGLIREMCSWIKEEMGAEVPLHFARFYPLYKLANLPPTPVSTIDRAREAALDVGLHHVYVSRVTGHEGEDSFCPSCGETIIERIGFVVEEKHLAGGKCKHCAAPIPGIWS